MRLAALVVLVLGAGMAGLGACSDDAGAGGDDGGSRIEGTSSGRSGSSGARSSSSGGGSSSSSSGGSSSSSSASSSGSSSGDAGRDAGNVGQECVFTGNYGCDPGLRCECEDDVNCTCQPGPRGAGGYNASCTHGNDCESGLCLGGPIPDGGFGDGGSRPHYCSKACTTQAECGVAPLSKCETQLTGICITP